MLLYTKSARRLRTREIMKLSANMEDYLEAVSFCANDKGVARVSDIRDMLGVKTPSVTGAMKALAEAGYVHHQPYSGIELTAKGRRAAEDVKKRHAILSRFLTQVLGVNPRTADMDACKMEHAVSRETLEKLHAYLHKQTGTEG
ncbi:MAG: metal-dependent transcriptional regulator [Elusimicrobia bacterium]|nr:metal-dependent transcriptional regulator [Elusimicrobiota bacterium]